MTSKLHAEAREELRLRRPRFRLHRVPRPLPAHRAGVTTSAPAVPAHLMSARNQCDRVVGRGANRAVEIVSFLVVLFGEIELRILGRFEPL